MIASINQCDVDLFVDAPNIDGVLRVMHGRRLRPNERPRWDRTRDYFKSFFGSVPMLDFVLNEAHMGDHVYGLCRALQSFGYSVVPASKVGAYPGNDDPVDEYILDRLYRLVSRRPSMHPSAVVVLAHDHIYSDPLIELRQQGVEVHICGLREQMAPALLNLERFGAVYHDLQYDLEAFICPPPRLYKRPRW